MPPDAAAPVLDLAAYAEISGRTWTGGDEALRRELIDRAVASDDWAAASARWTSAIDDEVATGGGELVLAFAARFEAGRRAASAPTVQAASSDGVDEAAPADLQPLAPVRHEVPSYLQAQAPDPTPERVAVPLARPPVVMAPPAALAAHTAPLDLEHMRNMLVRGPTPFKGATTPERLAELREEAHDSALAGGDTAPSTEETAMLIPSAALREHIAAIPFEAARSATTVAQPAPSALDGATDAIDLGKLRDVVQAGATPFAGSTSPERLAELRASAEVVARLAALGASTGPLPDADETAMHVPSAAQHLQTLPFTPATPEAIPVLTVDQYAAMTVELQGRNGSADVLSRYGIPTASALQAVLAEQERRFQADPSLRARFEERRAHFLRHFRKSHT